MRQSILLGFIVMSALALIGCAGKPNLPEKAGYKSRVSGEFDNSGEYSATVTILANYENGTFRGVMNDFRFSRSGFTSPSGSVPISGTISRNSDGEFVFAGSGKGRLTQASRSYALAIEMQSSYVFPKGNSVSFWYFGGGEFARRGRYQDWPGLKGAFEAAAFCKEVPFSRPCPPLSSAANGGRHLGRQLDIIRARQRIVAGRLK